MPLGAMRPMGFPPQRISPFSESVKIAWVPPDRLVRRRSISGPMASAAVARSALASTSDPLSSGKNVKPSRRPIKCPSTQTSPLSLTEVSIAVPVPIPLRRADVRRSTNLAMRPSCNASDRRSSTSRVRSIQYPGWYIQLVLFAQYVHVRICARRCDRISTLPLNSSSLVTCFSMKSSGSFPPCAINRRYMSCNRRTWASIVTFLKSGIWQTSHRRLTACLESIRVGETESTTSGIDASRSRASSSVTPWTRRKRRWGVAWCKL